MTDPAAPYHAHIYYQPGERDRAVALQADLLAVKGPDGQPLVLHVGALREGKVGPHPISQYEIHFLASSVTALRPVLAESGLKVLIHPLTDDDLADHTTLGEWLGSPLELDVSVLDPPGQNQGLARFGRSDF